MPAASRLIYDDSPPHARKHRWNEAEAGFVRDDDDGKLVGKCSNEIDLATAQALLDDGIPWSPRRFRSPFPERIFNVFAGIPYRAHRQAPRMYHGFPELPARIPGGPDGEIARALRSRAQREGFGDRFDAWIARWKDEP